MHRWPDTQPTHAYRHYDDKQRYKLLRSHKPSPSRILRATDVWTLHYLLRQHFWFGTVFDLRTRACISDVWREPLCGSVLISLRINTERLYLIIMWAVFEEQHETRSTAAKHKQSLNTLCMRWYRCFFSLCEKANFNIARLLTQVVSTVI